MFSHPTQWCPPMYCIEIYFKPACLVPRFKRVYMMVIIYSISTMRRNITGLVNSSIKQRECVDSNKTCRQWKQCLVKINSKTHIHIPATDHLALTLYPWSIYWEAGVPESIIWIICSAREQPTKPAHNRAARCCW